MSRQASVLTVTPSTITAGGTQTDFKVAALVASTASAVITLGKYRIFVINADQDITISFGLSSNITTPTVAFYRIPANQQTTFDLGPSADSIQVFNLATTAANIFIKALSVN